ncbi:MAG TPA: hypothetical protein VGS28_04990, partial [Candidatus Saccharimonadales bacterium]|nr:hypothetical protein [Candidatus Saccharimonadales bacterium]
MAEPVLILLIVIVIAVVGFAGWYVYHKRQENKTTNNATTSSTTASTTAAAGVNAACNVAYHDNVLCRSAAYMDLNKIPYSAVLTTTNNGTTTTFNVASDGKGNESLMGTSNGSAISTVLLDGKTYIKDAGSSTWLEYSGTGAPSTSNPTSNVNLGFTSNSIKYKNLGKTSCGSGGGTCYEYQVTDTTMPGTTQDAWISASTYY